MCALTNDNKLIRIFNTFGSNYLRHYADRMPSSHLKAFKDISDCRTITHGMIESVCEECGEVHHTFGACRNRACPKCNSLKNEEWIQATCGRFPNINYYHIVFTVPDELRYLARRNQSIFYSLLLSSVHKTLHAFSESDEWVNGKTGYMCVLHTWDSRMNIHPHVHVLFMGGYLNHKNEWIPLSDSKVFPNEAMSCRFKSVLLKSLRKYFQENIPSDIWKKKWIVYTKKAQTGDSHVIEYLGSYVKRVAIASSRIIDVNENSATFKYRHYVDRHTIVMKDMTVSGFEFLRRYLQHVLPCNFVRVRYYGLMHSAYTETIDKIKKSKGNVIVSERHNSKDPAHSFRECPTCNKPFIITMVIFPYYLTNLRKYNEKYRGKFYNTDEPSPDIRAPAKRGAYNKPLELTGPRRH